MDNPLQSELLHELTQQYCDLATDIRRLRQDLTDLRGQLAELKQAAEKSFKAAGFTFGAPGSSRNPNVSCAPSHPELAHVDLDKHVHEPAQAETPTMPYRGPGSGFLRKSRE